jgi:hypothetical protein
MKRSRDKYPITVIYRMYIDERTAITQPAAIPPIAPLLKPWEDPKLADTPKLAVYAIL